jgi:hypothetical protein
MTPSRQHPRNRTKSPTDADPRSCAPRRLSRHASNRRAPPPPPGRTCAAPMPRPPRATRRTWAGPPARRSCAAAPPAPCPPQCPPPPRPPAAGCAGWRLPTPPARRPCCAPPVHSRAGRPGARSARSRRWRWAGRRARRRAALQRAVSWARRWVWRWRVRQLLWRPAGCPPRAGWRRARSTAPQCPRPASVQRFEARKAAQVC